MSGAQIDASLREAVTEFLNLEARLADEHRYEQWEDLWADDALYWVPAAGDADPAKSVSFVYDNRSRIATRIKQLTTGDRYAQQPASALCRLVSNVAITSADADEVRAESSFLLFELRASHRHLWAGRTLWRLRHDAGRFSIAEKKVMLVDRDEDIPTMAFLI